MAKDKNSFVAYCDWGDIFDELDNEEAGKLVKHLFDYVRDKHPVAKDKLTKMMFIQIQQSLKRDLIKYEEKLDKKSLSGREGNLKRWNLDLYLEYRDNIHTIIEAEEIAKSRKVSQPDKKVSQSVAKIADSVSDNDSVSDIVNDIKEYSPEVLQTYEVIIKLFNEKDLPKTDKEKNNWIDTIDKCNRLDKYSFEDIIKITKKAKNDNFWTKQFLTINKLRAKNNEKIKYIRVFEEINDGKQNQQTIGTKVSQKTTVNDFGFPAG